MEQHSHSGESEEFEESDEPDEAQAILQELEERQELDYLKRYLIGRLIPIQKGKLRPWRWPRRRRN